MRFIENGPSIPDELLNARDEGRVVFFCGAGVSKAYARMPDFFGLVDAVIQELGVEPDSDALKVYEKSGEIGEELSITGLISADRIFGLLEREFTITDIQSAVTKSLKPNSKVDLKAHQILLRLATTPDSKIQLVTTNFDNLFDECEGECKIFEPPRLPDPSRFNDLDGIVYLHGRVNDDYTGPNGDGFILSSSDFGHAYLSDGWATKFFREIIQKYIVVFIGYSADDPPINYLLEGLKRTQNSTRRIYSFQAEDSNEAVARWYHKNVEPIIYSPENYHYALWETLERWAQRANDPELWRRKTIDLAMKGPENLQPHQRGQLAHIVSTHVGAREFTERKPSAEWLCVFDPKCRYARPKRLDWFDLESTPLDPFSLYGLDSDPPPEKIDPDNQFAKRDIPADAWDAFIATRLDHLNAPDGGGPVLRGDNAAKVPQLPKRLNYLGWWIGTIASQPSAIWWVAQQDNLHPSIRHSIWLNIKNSDNVPPVIRDAWRYLIEEFEHSNVDPALELYGLKDEIERDGWSLGAVRRLSVITRPYLKVAPSFLNNSFPPKNDTDYSLNELIRIEVECPNLVLEIPQDWLKEIIRVYRNNIDFAVRLCEEVEDPQLHHISSIERDNSSDLSDYEPFHRISGWVTKFASLFENLLKLDVPSAREEFLTWPTRDKSAFARLRLWASGKKQLVTRDEFYQVVMRLSDEEFWRTDYQRDLLIVLARRWSELQEDSRKKIENRLLVGPRQLKMEDEVYFKEHRAWSILNRIQWLENEDCEFSFDIAKEIVKLKQDAPTWKMENAVHAADSNEISCGFVSTNTEHALLLQEPISSILSKATEISGRSKTNTLEEYDPFAGLCDERPIRAYLALVRSAKKNDFPEWAWKTFLNSSIRKDDPTKFAATIAERLCLFPDESIAELLYPSTWWLSNVSKRLSKDYPSSFDKIIEKLIHALHFETSKGQFNRIDRGKDRDWATEAINSPTGHLARAIITDSRIDSRISNEPKSESWLDQLARLLSLKGDPRRHVITIISHNLSWFYYLAPEWTENHILSILNNNDDLDRKALWAGFLWNPKNLSPELYLRLKVGLIGLAKTRDMDREGYLRSLVNLIMFGWISLKAKDGKQCISNEELRDLLLHSDDNFRVYVLWYIQNGLSSDDLDTRKIWGTKAPEFFQRIWPRQKIVKNSKMTLRLTELLLSQDANFPELLELILPLLTNLKDGTGLHLSFQIKGSDLIKVNPKQFLQLLYAILPNEAQFWPYDIEDILKLIGEADNSLLSDARWKELMRKWNAR